MNRCILRDMDPNDITNDFLNRNNIKKILLKILYFQI